jgi:inner membrane protein involved in colicin E2 resistance
VRAWIVYSALRVGVFLALFALLFVLTTAIGLEPAWLISGCAAAVLALCISYIFFRGLRDRVALDVAAARTGAKTSAARAGSDEDAEDGARGA